MEKVKQVNYAKVCHAAIMAYSEGIGDYIFNPWNDESEWIKKYIQEMVVFVSEDPKADKFDCFEHWRTFMRKSGWTHGHKIDTGDQRHPMLSPKPTIEFLVQFELIISIVWALDAN
jgi:hypothetical protein